MRICTTEFTISAIRGLATDRRAWSGAELQALDAAPASAPGGTLGYPSVAFEVGVPHEILLDVYGGVNAWASSFSA